MGKKHINSMRVLIGLLLATAFITPLSAQTGREIMDKVLENQKPDSSAMDMQMKLIDSRGNESLRRIQTLTLDDNGNMKSITLFMEPANIRNTRFLTIQNEGRDDDQWIYLPSLRKVKRIAAGERDGSFMGSDFSYSDMSGGDLDDSAYTILKEENVESRDCWVIESKPEEGKNSSYGKTISWVDKESYLTLKVIFYDDDGTTILKELDREGIKNVDGFWIAEKTTMKTIESNHSTVLEIKQIKHNIPINSGYFTTNFLNTGRL